MLGLDKQLRKRPNASPTHAFQLRCIRLQVPAGSCRYLSVPVGACWFLNSPCAGDTPVPMGTAVTRSVFNKKMRSNMQNELF